MYNRHDANPDRAQSNDSQALLLPLPRRFARRPRCSLLVLLSTAWCGVVLLLLFNVSQQARNYRVPSNPLTPETQGTLQVEVGLPSSPDLVPSEKWGANTFMSSSLIYSQNVSYTNNLIYSNLPTLPPATRCFLLFGVMAGNDPAVTYRTVDSVVSKTSYDRNDLPNSVQIMIMLPYRLRSRRAQFLLHYNTLIESGRLFVHVAPLESSEVPLGTYANAQVTRIRRQRTLDFSYELQIAAVRSSFFLSFAAGMVLSRPLAVDEIKRVLKTNDRWSTISFLPDSADESLPPFLGKLFNSYASVPDSADESLPPFLGKLFNSSEALRVATTLRTFRSAHPAEFIMDKIQSKLMVASKRLQSDIPSFIHSSRPVQIYVDQSRIDDSTSPDVVEHEWSWIRDASPTQPTDTGAAYEYQYAFGIPSAHRRGVFFLGELVKDLLQKISEFKVKAVIVVMLMTEGDWDQSARSKLKAEFGSQLESGILRVFSHPSASYPSLDGLRQNYDDLPPRVRWRSKQNLDYSSLFAVSRGLARYFVLTEDDVDLKPGFFNRLSEAIAQQPNPDWFLVDICPDIGFGCKILQDQSLWAVQVLLWTFFDELPCDWMIHVNKDLSTNTWFSSSSSVCGHKGQTSTFDLKNTLLQVKASDVELGSYIQISSHPCKVTSISDSADERQFVGFDVIDSQVYSMTEKADKPITQPIVVELETEVLGIEGGLVICNEDGARIKDLALPSDALLSSKLQDAFAAGDKLMVTVIRAPSEHSDSSWVYRILSFKSVTQ